MTNCQQCGKVLEGKRADARFCSTLCRVRADRARKRKPRVRAYVPTEVARFRYKRGYSERNLRRKLRTVETLDRLKGPGITNTSLDHGCELDALAALADLDDAAAINLMCRASKGEWVSARTVLAAIDGEWTYAELREFCRTGDCAPLLGTRLRRY